MEDGEEDEEEEGPVEREVYYAIERLGLQRCIGWRLGFECCLVEIDGDGMLERYFIMEGLIPTPPCYGS
jgi:hypothetical protein